MILASLKFNMQFLKLKFFNKKTAPLFLAIYRPQLFPEQVARGRFPSFNTDRNGRPDE